jgi:hypothetical protein
MDCRRRHRASYGRAGVSTYHPRRHGRRAVALPTWGTEHCQWAVAARTGLPGHAPHAARAARGRRRGRCRPRNPPPAAPDIGRFTFGPNRGPGGFLPPFPGQRKSGIGGKGNQGLGLGVWPGLRVPVALPLAACMFKIPHRALGAAKLTSSQVAFDGFMVRFFRPQCGSSVISQLGISRSLHADARSTSGLSSVDRGRGSWFRIRPRL